MVFNYKRKSNRAAWSEETLGKAIRAVKEDRQSINSTAKKFGIPFTTLQRHVKSGKTSKKLVQNAVNGFKKPGLWPYDPNVFGEEDYAPSTMTDRPYNDASSTMTESSVNDAPSIMADSSFNGAWSTMIDCSFNDPLTTINTVEENRPVPSASLTPLQIRPIPTMAASKTGRKHNRQKSEVLTSTPVKAEQENKDF